MWDAKFEAFSAHSVTCVLAVFPLAIWSITRGLQVKYRYRCFYLINPLNPELNPICYLLALLGAHHFLHVSRIRVKSLSIRRLMSYIYIYDISRLRVN